ncbi:PEP-CTERM sorting domain-containing protein [Paucibacter sp. TC2R-5]|uniref:PEP-CTERM sorting domain-containing protein n=1 Tax=Paucibacter sp. TC2R-5 TaxID=2893555 RepID=UPI0021E35D8F|nr:PEP-CTERM sorting domain-containing protein [Paucibacter sp. TC2R-5]MCV2360012.1 PEP-CTERM sorting domain-containing protein [Paucibacter sp. TC2R-5]
MKLTKTITLAAVLALFGTAHAASLIDTGSPDASKPGYALDTSNFLAVQFNAGAAWHIDGLSAYLSGGKAGEHFTVALYADSSAHLPGDLIAASTVEFSTDGWNKSSALNWSLPTAGSYWLALEGATKEVIPGLPEPDGSFVANAGGLTMPGLTAFSDGGFAGYQASPGIEFGLQITGAVPEPSSYLLLLAGLGLVGATRIKANRRSDKQA